MIDVNFNNTDARIGLGQDFYLADGTGVEYSEDQGRRVFSPSLTGSSQRSIGELVM
jgi:hypothetical protein